jgi:transcriptional regulator with XRE-family HTH domain
MNEKEEFANRLRDAMAVAGYEARPTILEKEFNSRYWGRSVTFQAVSRWLRGEAIPSQDKLQVLADWLGVEPHVLRFGTRVSTKVRDKKKRWEEGVGYLEREVFEAFLSLPTMQRKALREVILGLAQANKNPGKG